MPWYVIQLSRGTARTVPEGREIPRASETTGIVGQPGYATEDEARRAAERTEAEIQPLRAGYGGDPDGARRSVFVVEAADSADVRRTLIELVMQQRAR